MASSSFHQWVSDPLFSAAEVVQDSADRMESSFRLLLHEISLVQEGHTDQKLITSIEYHRRDLATTLETAKWQLEDFEREVSLSATIYKSHMRQETISRHRQFIIAIREQIIHVEKTLEKSLGKSVRNEWVNLNEQDRDGLALFLSGEKSAEHVVHHDLDDHNMITRFLDPPSSSSFNNEIVKQKIGETVSLNMNGFVNIDNDFDMKDYNLRNAGSHFSAQLGSEAPSSFHEAPCDRHDKDGSWDLEAIGTKGNSISHKNKWRGLYSKMNLFGSIGHLIYAYASRSSRSFTKRWKDGEEQGHSSQYIDVSQAVQSHITPLRLPTGRISYQRLWSEFPARVTHFNSWLGERGTRYQRSLYGVQVSQYFVKLMSAILLTLLVIGIVASQVA